MSKIDNHRVKKSGNDIITPLYAASLKNVRIIQKHLVYVIGLSSNLASKEVVFILFF